MAKFSMVATKIISVVRKPKNDYISERNNIFSSFGQSHKFYKEYSENRRSLRSLEICS